MTEKKDDGGPAFPHIKAEGHRDYAGGMTLRDYFAAKAMQTILQSNAPWPLPDDLSEWAIKSYLIADTLLEARKRSAAPDDDGPREMEDMR